MNKFKKLPKTWEILLLVIVNIFMIMSTYGLIILIAFIFGLPLPAQSSPQIPDMYEDGVVITLLLWITLVPVFILVRNFFIYITLKFLERFGSDEMKEIIKEVRRSTKLKLIIFTVALVIDFTIIKIWYLANSLTNYSGFATVYFITSSLAIPYLVTFIIWSIGDGIKKLRNKKHETKIT